MNSHQRRLAVRSHPLYRKVKDAIGRNPRLQDFKLIEAVTRKLQGMDDPYQVKSQTWGIYGSNGELRATFEAPMPAVMFLPEKDPITATVPIRSLRITNLLPSNLSAGDWACYGGGALLPDDLEPQRTLNSLFSVTNGQ